MDDGILLIDKPAGMTSFGVVARIRRVLSEKKSKKIKVGHTGTLDPFATGLMILVIGSECKNAGLYSKMDKVYEAVICLGQNSTTGDPEGKTSVISSRVPSETEIKNTLKIFTGEITQRPPVYSAIKINGQRAYNLAREGKVFEIPIRNVTVYNIDLIKYDYPYIIIKTRVSSGTYIRSLAEDIGKKLEVGAYCKQLRRLEISKWRVEDARKLSDFGINS